MKSAISGGADAIASEPGDDPGSRTDDARADRRAQHATEDARQHAANDRNADEQQDQQRLEIEAAAERRDGAARCAGSGCPVPTTSMIRSTPALMPARELVLRERAARRSRR